MEATMRRIPSKRQLKTQANYNLVLDTAITLFNERGYDETTMGDISSATGLSNGSLYNMFHSKTEILKQIYNRNINVSIGLTNNIEEKIADPYKYLLKFMLDTQALWLKTGTMLLANKNRWDTQRTTEGCSPIQRAELTAFISLAQKVGTISSKNDPDTTVEFLFTFQRGMLYGWMGRVDFDINAYAEIFWPPVINALVKGTLVIDKYPLNTP